MNAKNFGDLAGKLLGAPLRYGFGPCHVLDFERTCMYIVRMPSSHVEWDSRKEKANLKKHGVWFKEARRVF